MNYLLNKEWDEVLNNTINSKIFSSFILTIKQDYKNETIYPDYKDIFKAYNLTDYNKVRVVIIGQDPYHDGSADGLCFSNSYKTDKISPSLRNIFKELEIEYGIKRTNYDLTNWAKQGTFLINTILTVKKGKPLSYKDSYWLEFTKETIVKLNSRNTPIVFLLLGSYAQNYEKLITNPIHRIVKTNHPSPLSAYRGFFYSNCFKQVNEYLSELKMEQIDYFK